MLKHEFLGTNTDGYMELYKDLCWKFMHKFDAFEKCNNYLDYWDHVKWLDSIVTTNTTNVVKGTFKVLNKKKGNEKYDKLKKDLLAKILKV